MPDTSVEHVPGVGQQREAVRGDRADDLDDQDEQAQAETAASRSRLAELDRGRSSECRDDRAGRGAVSARCRRARPICAMTRRAWSRLTGCTVRRRSVDPLSRAVDARTCGASLHSGCPTLACASGEPVARGRPSRRIRALRRYRVVRGRLPVIDPGIDDAATVRHTSGSNPLRASNA